MGSRQEEDLVSLAELPPRMVVALQEEFPRPEVPSSLLERALTDNIEKGLALFFTNNL